MSQWYRGFITLTIVLSVYLLIMLVTDTTVIKRESADINLREFDFDNQVIKLDGNWAFAWKKLLDGSEMTDNQEYLIEVPSTWNGYTKDIGGDGYASYGIHIYPNTRYDQIALKVPHMSTAFRILLNDQVLYEAGRVSDVASEVEGSYERPIITYSQPESDYWLVVQIANNDYARGGFWYSILMGTPELIQGIHTRRIIAEGMLLGALFILGIYHFFIFINRDYSQIALYLGLMFTIGSARAGVTGENLLYWLVRGADYHWFVRIEYLGILLGPYFFMKFIEKFFEKYSWSRLSVVIWGAVGVAVLSMLLLPIFWMTSLVYVYELLALMVFLYALIIVINAVRNKASNSIRIFQSIVIFAATFIIDALFHATVFTLIDFPIVTIFGFYIAYTQSVALASEYHIKDTYKKELLDSQMRFLQAQIRPHFIQNTLNSSISLIESDPMRAEEVLLDFSDYLRNSMHYTSSDASVSIEEELQHLSHYINIEKIRYQDRLSVVVDFDGKTFSLSPLLIQPLVENAIKHNLEKFSRTLHVHISVWSDKDYHRVSVSDDGIGFDVEATTYGIGLTNVRNRLERLYNEKLQIISKKSQGTSAVFCIPRSIK